MSSGIKDSESGSPAHVDAMETPPMIDGYRFARMLGRGGMGVVWEAIQLGTARRVAVKFMGAALLHENARRRFSREVKLAARLTHPHIVRIYDSGLHQNAYYYVMELVDGPALDEAIKAGCYLPDRVVRLMAVVCRAVEYAHAQGVIHRDLKPANILVSADGSPHILDFGLAREFVVDPDDAAEGFLVSSEGDRTGTPVYMSPEQAAGKTAVTPATDVYSIGAVLYHLLTGRYAHDPRLPRMELYHQIATVPAPPLCEVAEGLPKSLEQVLAGAMTVDPRERFQSAGEMADALLACVNSSLPPGEQRAESATARGPVGARGDYERSSHFSAQREMKPAPPESTPVDRRKLVTMTFAALAVALIAGVGAWRMFVPAAAPSPTTAEERLAASGIRIVAVAPAGAEAAAGSRLSPQRLQALGEMIRQKLEQRLAGEPDIKVAERARLDAVFRERNFSAANPANMAAGAKAIGASVLVAPALVDLDTRSQTFSGYGVSTSRTTVTASILIRLIDVPTSTIKYSATFQGRAVRESSTFSPETGGDAESEAIRDAIGKACADPSFVKAVKS